MLKIIRLPVVLASTGVSRSHLYAQMQRGDFPRPIRLGRRAVGWRLEDVENWLASRPLGGRWTGSK